MRYRIKKVIYKDGEVKHFPQYYKGFFSGWRGLRFDGEKYIYNEEGYAAKTRERALEIIDLADKGKGEVQTIEFEYVNK